MCINIIQHFSGNSALFNFILTPQLVLDCEIISLILMLMQQKILMLSPWKQFPEEKGCYHLLIYIVESPVYHLVSAHVVVEGHLFLRQRENF